MTQGGALDVRDAEPVNESDASLKGRSDEKAVDAIEPDDVPNLAARREAAQLHGDAFIVKTDLEDQDERSSSPGKLEED
ncbi:hypothetical protein BJF93_05435 [Xaviernesmea oryzae]|uniref:Uncharacterized protein n=1 Tax=Xaviernesmea oryzae TaxID=464029 RepID=A0A1Q9ASM2_9HYPH|nr:hypothetical protein [Xaviernesmea oryzae]OLP58361.1 hypothetical protein BJF93_05435 [Xaviernesmea oryzae]